MLFYDQRFSHDTNFKFFMFIRNLRHKCNNSVNWKINGNDITSQKYIELVNSPSFTQDINNALANPEHVDSKKWLKKYLP